MKKIQSQRTQARLSNTPRRALDGGELHLVQGGHNGWASSPAPDGSAAAPLGTCWPRAGAGTAGSDPWP